MTVDLSDYFWGEGQKSSGIEVLFLNAKSGVACVREVVDFLKETSSISESQSKALYKLSKISSNVCSSFSPMFQLLKGLTEKLSAAHSANVAKIEELSKELSKYADELQKQYKSLKEGESPTVDSIQVYQNAKNMVIKSKALYMQRYLELEKIQKDSPPPKELERAESKMKKAQEEYKSWVEKYQSSTEEYVSKMTESCRKFQDVEIFYLEKMKEFMNNYSTIIESNHEAVGELHCDFRLHCSNQSVEDLLVQLVRQKATGNTRPCANVDVDDMFNLEISQSGSSVEDKSETTKGAVDTKIVEGNSDNENSITSNSVSNSLSLDGGKAHGGSVSAAKPSRRTTSLLNLFIPQSQGNKKGAIDSPLNNPNPGDLEAPLARSINRGSKWFLRSKRGKKKEKKGGKKHDEEGNQDVPESGSQVGGEPVANCTNTSQSQVVVNSPLKVDAEGFTIRPTDVWEEEKGNFYSDSDTDSDEEPEKRLHVEIKPLTNGSAPLSASVDELRTTVENLTLSSTGSAIMSRKGVIDLENQMKRSQSVSQQIGSASSSPPPRHPYAPLSPSSILLPNPNLTSSSKTNSQVQNDSLSRYAELGTWDFSVIEDTQPALPPKATTNSKSTSSTAAIPRPPSRPRAEIPLIPQRLNNGSPSPVVSRTESIASLETRSFSQGSRGPSPLTLGLTDQIPIAIAFHEIVHAYFKGNDENKCKVKMTGDMMISFPAGIIQVFANNPSPVQLKFQVRSKQPLENLVSNKNLVKVEKVEDVLEFEFDMSALTVLLKNHAEQNPSASYFNVDILKYQIQPKPGVRSCPLHLVAFWKCEPSQTDLRIDYKYNSRAMELTQTEVKTLQNASTSNSAPAALSQVCIAAPVDGGVKTMQAKPSGSWYASTNRACWKLSSLSTKSENQGVGSLRARFEISAGPSSNGTIAAQFSCENSTLSGCDFELSSNAGYRVSLIKKRFVSGKYICDCEENSNRYAVPVEYTKPIQV